jgi:hypothetical protein
MSTSFTDRVKSRTSQPTQSVTIVEAENDFAFESIDFVRIGSAHTVCDPSQDDENANLLLRVSIMRRYEPDLLPAKVVIEHKSDSPSFVPCSEVISRTDDANIASSVSKHFESSFLDRRWLKELYACVIVMGHAPGGSRAYCYFGVFANTLIDFIDRYKPTQPFNPIQLKAVVLARSTGYPSIEIREFMRAKFSFDSGVTILEVSRSD